MVEKMGWFSRERFLPDLSACIFSCRQVSRRHQLVVKNERNRCQPSHVNNSGQIIQPPGAYVIWASMVRSVVRGHVDHPSDHTRSFPSPKWPPPFSPPPPAILMWTYTHTHTYRLITVDYDPIAISAHKYRSTLSSHQWRTNKTSVTRKNRELFNNARYLKELVELNFTIDWLIHLKVPTLIFPFFSLTHSV